MKVVFNTRFLPASSLTDAHFLTIPSIKRTASFSTAAQRIQQDNMVQQASRILPEMKAPSVLHTLAVEGFSTADE